MKLEHSWLRIIRLVLALLIGASALIGYLIRDSILMAHNYYLNKLNVSYMENVQRIGQELLKNEQMHSPWFFVNPICEDCRKNVSVVLGDIPIDSEVEFQECAICEERFYVKHKIELKENWFATPERSLTSALICADSWGTNISSNFISLNNS